MSSEDWYIVARKPQSPDGKPASAVNRTFASEFHYLHESAVASVNVPPSQIVGRVRKSDYYRFPETLSINMAADYTQTVGLVTLLIVLEQYYGRKVGYLATTELDDLVQVFNGQGTEVITTEDFQVFASGVVRSLALGSTSN